MMTKMVISTSMRVFIFFENLSQRKKKTNCMNIL